MTSSLVLIADAGVLPVADPILGGAPVAAPQIPRMYIYAETTGTIALNVPYAPQSIEYDGMAQNWTSTTRSGTTPLLLRSGDNLATMKFSLTLASPNRFDTQTAAFTQLKALCKTQERVLVRYGPNEAGLWRITACTITSSQRHPTTNEITQAVASITMTAASDAAPAVGPILPPPPPPAPPTPPAPRSYVVVKGDTLWGISLRYYGAGAKWPTIYDANRNLIKDPHWIYPGQRFVIP